MVPTLLIALGAVDAVGTGMNAYLASEGIRAEGRYQKHLALYNAHLSRRRAKSALEAGYRRSSALLRDAGQLEDAQAVAQAASGLQLDFGTPLEIREETEQLSALDAMEIRKDAYLKVMGIDIETAQYEYAARSAKLQARSQSRATLIAGGFGIVKGLLSAGANASQFATSGAPGGGAGAPPAGGGASGASPHRAPYSEMTNPATSGPVYYNMPEPEPGPRYYDADPKRYGGYV